MKRCFLFQRRTEPDWSRSRRAAFWLWNAGWLALAAAGLTAVTLLLAVGPYSTWLLHGYLDTPLILLLNFLPVAGLLALLWGLTGRSWLAYLLTGVLFVGGAAGNYYKLFFRDDPVLFADLLILKEAGDMAGKYHLFLDKRLALALFCFLVGLAVLALLVRGRPRWIPGRTAGVLAGLALLAAGVPLALSDGIYDGAAASYDYLPNRWSDTQRFVAHGFVYPFLHSVNDAVDTPPADYDAAAAEAQLAQYTDADIPAEKKVNVVAIMLEAYNDFTKFGTPELAQDVYAVWHRLEEEGVSGDLVTNIFAGGTVDTERSFLTGYTSLRSYRSAVNAYPWYFRGQGYRVEGMHPCFDWFYNRRNVNSYLGFERYDFVENHFGALTDGGVAYDDVFFPELLSRIRELEAGDQPYFSFSVTYQGHGPYDTDHCWWGEKGDFVVPAAGRTEEQQYILDNYFGSLANTNEHLAELTDYLRDSDEPTVLVLFGDHNPWMGDGNSVYTALGIDFDLGTQTGFRNYYSTRYIIWANDAAKAALGSDFTGTGPEIGPYFLMNELFALCGWDGPAYMQLADGVMDAVPVIHTTGRYIENGAVTTALGADAAETVERFLDVEYAYSHGSVKWRTSP